MQFLQALNKTIGKEISDAWDISLDYKEGFEKKSGYEGNKNKKSETKVKSNNNTKREERTMNFGRYRGLQYSDL